MIALADAPTGGFDRRYGPLPLAWWIVLGLLSLGLVFGGLNALANRRYRFVDGLVQGVVGSMGSGKSLFVVQRVLLPYCRSLSRGKGVVPSLTGRPTRRVVTNFTFNPGMPHVEVRTVQPTADETVFDALVRLSHEIGVVEGEGPWRDPETGLIHDRCPHGELRGCCARQPILNALVVLDEMHLFAGSSQMAMGKAAAFVISMVRKYNAELWWLSQHEMKVHKRLRDDSTYVWLASRLGGPLTALIGTGWHVAAKFHAHDHAAMRTARVRQLDRRIYRFSPRVKALFNSFELLVPDPEATGGRRRSSSVHDALGVTGNDGGVRPLALDPAPAGGPPGGVPGAAKGGARVGSDAPLSVPAEWCREDLAVATAGAEIHATPDTVAELTPDMRTAPGSEPEAVLGSRWYRDAHERT